MPRWAATGRLLFRSALLLGLLFALNGCEGEIEDLLDALSGDPGSSGVSGASGQHNAPVPAGAHLYCITNIGHTMVAYSLDNGEVLADTRRVLELDPVGPWFVDGAGFYISRVDGSGAGANALIRFDPRTLAEVARLNFPGNSNPASMLALPGSTTAYVALRGSTFDNFASSGLAVVDLSTMSQTAYLDFNDSENFVGGEALASLAGFVYDGACATGGDCVYALVNNWRNAVRAGWLLVLEPAGGAAPVITDAVALGDSPLHPMLLDEANGRLWVVNNGGYVNASSDSGAGTLQVLDTGGFADGRTGNETLATIQIESTCNPAPSPDTGCDPTGIFSFSAGEAWVTTYPDDVVRTVSLAGLSLNPLDASLPAVTGPLLVSTSTGELYAGMGGFAAGLLGRLSANTGELLDTYDLQSGNGPVQCAEFTQN